MSSQGLFFQTTPPIGLRVASLVGITTSAYLFGANASISYITMRCILKAPAPIAIQQWAEAYAVGSITGPALALISTLATGYVTYLQDPKSLAFKLNLAATILVPSMIPLTFAFIAPTNHKLLEKKKALAATSVEDKAAEVGVAREETVHALIDKWATLNLARALVIGAGAVAAAWGAVSRLEVVGFSEIGLRSGANRLG